jgi:folate-binding protein YgfZ
MTVAPRPLDLAGARSGAAVYLDASRTRIALTGDDRFRWLNGVVSNDVLALEKGKGARAMYACALNEKGKILGDLVIIAEGTELAVWAPAAVAPALASHWERYVIMDDVEIALDADRRLIMLQGGRAHELASDTGIAPRAASFDDLGVGGGVCLEAQRSEAEPLIARLVAQGAVSLEVEDVHTLRVLAGRATFGFDFDDKTYVQEAGLEKRAVDFQKGCYHGQEVVCMLEMRGHVSKRLVQLAIAGDGVQPGAEVLAGEASVGRVTSIVHEATPREAVALALLKLAHARPGEQLSVRGHAAEVRALTT